MLCILKYQDGFIKKTQHKERNKMCFLRIFTLLIEYFIYKNKLICLHVLIEEIFTHL